MYNVDTTVLCSDYGVLQPYKIKKGILPIFSLLYTVVD